MEVPAAMPELERELARAFLLENATYRLQEIAPTFSWYFLLVYHVISSSDDRREEIIHLAGMERRMARDPERLNGYHSDLRAEAAAPIEERKRRGKMTRRWMRNGCGCRRDCCRACHPRKCQRCGQAWDRKAG